MARTLAHQCRVKFGAATLHLQTSAVEVRAALSSEQAAALGALLEDGYLCTREREDLTELVVSTIDRGWEATDRSSLLRSIDAASKPRRRKGQTWSPHVLNVFTEEEWASWKARGISGINETLVAKTSASLARNC